MKTTYDVTALGELLADVYVTGKTGQGGLTMEANPAGAPCNLLAMLSKLSRRTSVICKVGKDMFGDLLEAAVKNAGIDTSGIMRDPLVNTTLAFVHNKEDGDREFSFYRNPGADMMISEEDVESCRDMIEGSRLFHFSTLSMTHEGCRKATMKAVDMAAGAGRLISFDPNLREPLWKTLDEAREMVAYGMSKCHILKISDNEVEWFCGTDDYDAAAAAFKKTYPNIKLITISLGKDGSRGYYKDHIVNAAPFLQENTIDTTGAGDTCCACILNYILDHDIEDLSADNIQEMLTFANAAASIITTRKGALSVMPEKAEIEELIRRS